MTYRRECPLSWPLALRSWRKALEDGLAFLWHSSIRCELKHQWGRLWSQLRTSYQPLSPYWTINKCSLSYQKRDRSLVGNCKLSSIWAQMSYSVDVSHCVSTFPAFTRNCTPSLHKVFLSSSEICVRNERSQFSALSSLAAKLVFTSPVWKKYLVFLAYPDLLLLHIWRKSA